MLEEKIVELRKQGLSYRQINEMGVASMAHIGRTCRKYNLGETTVKNNEKQRNTEEKIAEMLNANNDCIEYVGGYTNTHNAIRVRCKTCGMSLKETTMLQCIKMLVAQNAERMQE